MQQNNRENQYYKSIENKKFLLNLIIHRYEEEERRKKDIDTKNNYFIVLTGAILLLYYNLYNLDSVNILFLNIGTVLIFISLLFFIFSIFFDKFSFSPNPDTLTNWIEDDKQDIEKMIEILSKHLNETIETNKQIINKQVIIGKHGCYFLMVGILILCLHILLKM